MHVNNKIGYIRSIMLEQFNCYYMYYNYIEWTTGTTKLYNYSNRTVKYIMLIDKVQPF